MRKELTLFLSCAVMLAVMISGVNAHEQKSTNQITFPFDDDGLFVSNDEVFNQIKTMQHAMDALLQHQFTQIYTNQLNFVNSKNSLDSSQAIQMEERNNELIYQIKQPQGADSKIDVAVKDGLLIVKTQIMQRASHTENGSKRISHSQVYYSQISKLPRGYDPNSMDIKTKDTHLIVTFKKQSVSPSLKI